MADFGKYPNLKAMESRGWIFSGLVFVDARTPKRFRQAIINHEIRENILRHTQHPDPEANGKNPDNMPHMIAMQREFRDLKKTGLLDEYLAWLKKNSPGAFDERNPHNRQNRQ